MPVIRNLSDRPVLIALNGGGSLRVSPGTVSEPVPEVDVQDNPTIDKLLQQRAIAVVSESADNGAATEGDTDPSPVRAPTARRTGGRKDA